MLQLRPLQRWLNSQRLSVMTQKHVLVAVTLACFHTLKHWSRKDHLLRGVPLGVLPVRRVRVRTDRLQTMHLYKAGELCGDIRK